MGLSIFSFDFASMFGDLDEISLNIENENLPIDEVSTTSFGQVEEILSNQFENELFSENQNAIVNIESTDYFPSKSDVKESTPISTTPNIETTNSLPLIPNNEPDDNNPLSTNTDTITNVSTKPTSNNTIVNEISPKPTKPISTLSLTASQEYKKAIEALIKTLQTSVIYSFQSSDIVTNKLNYINQSNNFDDNNSDEFDKQTSKFKADSDKKRDKYDQLQQELKIAMLKEKTKTDYV